MNKQATAKNYKQQNERNEFNMNNEKKKKIILHLCATHGSDSRHFQLDDDYKVIIIGEDVGVENFSAHGDVYGIIANPVCTKFSMVAGVVRTKEELDEGMFLVNHCMRIINDCKKTGSLKFWVLENPAAGMLHTRIGKPAHKYQPWQYGSPWTKNTALWGEFNMPKPTVINRADTVLREGIYIRPRDTMPSLAILHKSAIQFMPEYAWCRDDIKCDSDLRSLCSDGFAKQFYLANKELK